MLINFVVGYVHGGWEPDNKRLGGTEDSVVKWASILSDRGHVVQVYRNGLSRMYHDVLYLPREEYTESGDVTINVNSSDTAPIGPTLYITTETDATQKDLSQYSAVLWPSQWGVDNIPVNNKNIYILPYGYDETLIYPGEKIRKQCLYASSPDRGLVDLLRAWPKIYSAHPDATLKVTYGAPIYDYPGIDFLGEATEDEMNQLYKESEYWVHPCNGGELYCITGIKAQAAGCWPVIIPTMALSETVTYGTFCTKENYAEKLIEALYEHPEPPVNPYPTWTSTTDRLLEIISDTIKT